MLTIQIKIMVVTVINIVDCNDKEGTVAKGYRQSEQTRGKGGNVAANFCFSISDTLYIITVVK